MSHQAVAWALYESPMLLTAAGKPDTTARFVLVVYAERADKDGRDAFPGPAYIKFATGLDVRTVERAVRRLEEAGVLVRDGFTAKGAVRWRLDLAVKRPASDWTEIEAAQTAEREATAERVRKHRTKTPVTDAESVTAESESEPVTESASVRNGRRLRSVTDATPGEPPQEPPGEPTWGAPPLHPRRTDPPQAACRADLVPEPEQSKTSPTQVDRESPVPSAREQLPAVDLGADPDHLDAIELAETIKALMAHDLQRLRTIRFAARKKLGIASVTSSPRQREDLNRAIYRAWREEETTSA